MLGYDQDRRKRRPVYRAAFLVRVLNKWPGKAFGYYRFMPAFFALGALLEFTMINWRPNGHNFYDTYKRRTAQEIVKAEMIEKEIEARRARNQEAEKAKL